MPSPTLQSDPAAPLGFWLRHVSSQVSHRLAGKLAAKGVTVAEWVMLRAIHGQDPMSPSRLAQDMEMTRGAVTRLADRLIGKSLIVREANQDDGRAQTLALTPKGTSLVPELAALADQNDAELFDHLPAVDRKTLERLLKQISGRLHTAGAEHIQH